MESKTYSLAPKKVALKLQTLSKTKRIREVPESFQALKSIVEA